MLGTRLVCPSLYSAVGLLETACYSLWVGLEGVLALHFVGPRIFEGRLLLGRWLQATQQEAHRAYQNHALTGVRSLLVILAITPA